VHTVDAAPGITAELSCCVRDASLTEGAHRRKVVNAAYWCMCCAEAAVIGCAAINPDGGSYPQWEQVHIWNTSATDPQLCLCHRWRVSERLSCCRKFRKC
jgi:hypothetical protein